MEILFLLIPLSLGIGLAIGVAAWYAVGSGQFDDLDRPALEVLADDDDPRGFVDVDQPVAARQSR